MPEPAVVDHILAGTALVDPLIGVWAYRRMVQRVRAGDVNARAAQYRKMMLLSWTLTIPLVAFWLLAGRPAAALGFAAPGGAPLLLGAIIPVLALAFLYAQWRAVSVMGRAGR